MANWYVSRDGKEQGPFTSDQLRQLAASGEIRPETPVRREDKQTAIPASHITSLYPTLPQGPPNTATAVPPLSSPVIAAVAATPRPAPPIPSAGGSRTTFVVLAILGTVVGVFGLTTVCCCGIIGMTRHSTNTATSATNAAMKKLLSQKGFRPQPMPSEQYQGIMTEIEALHTDDFEFTIIGEERGREIAEKFKNVDPQTLFTVQEVAALQVPIGGESIQPQYGTFKDKKGNEQNLPSPIFCWSQYDGTDSTAFAHFYVSESDGRFRESKGLRFSQLGRDTSPECRLDSMEFTASDGMAIEVMCDGTRIMSIVCKILGRSTYATVPDHVRLFDSDRNEYRREIVFKGQFVKDDDRRLLKIEFAEDGTYTLIR